jgi:ubiquinone/menaquinone biosynthesis C-methylase UbiE
MPHKFDSHHAGHLENPLRKLIRPAGPVLKRLGLRAGDVFLDVGAGTGYYAFPASAIVGIGGTVLAVDEDPRMVELLMKRSDETKALNVRVIRATDVSLNLADGVADAALLSMVLHEVEDPARTLGEVRRALKKGGRLAVVDFAPGSSPFGPPVSVRISAAEAGRLLEAAGFAVTESERLSFSQYIVTARAA